MYGRKTDIVRLCLCGLCCLFFSKTYLVFEFYDFKELYDVWMIHSFQNFQFSGQKFFSKVFWRLSTVNDFHRHPLLEFFAVSALDLGIGSLTDGRADAVAEFLEVDFIIGARKLLDGSAHVREKLEHTCRLVGGVLLLTNAQADPLW